MSDNGVIHSHSKNKRVEKTKHSDEYVFTLFYDFRKKIAAYPILALFILPYFTSIDRLNQYMHTYIGTSTNELFFTLNFSLMISHRRSFKVWLFSLAEHNTEYADAVIGPSIVVCSCPCFWRHPKVNSTHREHQLIVRRHQLNLLHWLYLLHLTTDKRKQWWRGLHFEIWSPSGIFIRFFCSPETHSTELGIFLQKNFPSTQSLYIGSYAFSGFLDSPTTLRTLWCSRPRTTSFEEPPQKVMDMGKMEGRILRGRPIPQRLHAACVEHT